MSRALGSLKLTDLVLLEGEGGGGGLTDTDDLPEGATNLYYTDARARAALSVQANRGLTYNSGTGVIGHDQDLRTTGAPTFGGLTVGSLAGVLKASSGLVSGSATTTDLPEGSNLYFTNARVASYLTGLSGTDDSATFLRGDNTWSDVLTGGLSVGSVLGAAAGEVRAAGAFYAGGLASGRLNFRSVTLSTSGQQLMDVTTGVCLVFMMEVAAWGAAACYLIQGGLNTVTEMFDPLNRFTANTSSPASGQIGIFNSAGTYYCVRHADDAGIILRVWIMAFS